MSKSDYFEVDGIVRKCLGNAMFDVEVPNGLLVRCTISGKIRKNFIKITSGDSVTVEVSTYDMTKGRIVWRGR